MDVSRKIKGFFFFKELRVLKRILKEVQRIFQVSFKGISRKFHGCFKKVSRACQCWLKSVLEELYGIVYSWFRSKYDIWKVVSSANSRITKSTAFGKSLMNVFNRSSLKLILVLQFKLCYFFLTQYY